MDRLFGMGPRNLYKLELVMPEFAKHTRPLHSVLRLHTYAMATFTSKEGSDILAHYARTIMERRTDTLKEKPAPKPSAPRAGDSNVVGIMGAGVGGLYTAIMLQSLDVPFEIIEASDRVGGRLFT